MPQLIPTPQFAKEFRKLHKNNPKLSKKADKQLQLLISNPNHPSLRLHKLTGKLQEHWSIAINMNLRIIFHYEDQNIILQDLGTHNQVYQ